MPNTKKRMNVYLDLNNLETEAEQYSKMGLILDYTELIRIVSKDYALGKVYFLVLSLFVGKLPTE